MKTKIYLDTSIISAYFDYSKPIRQLITQKWFENETERFELFVSVITIEEIEKFKNIEKRENIKNLLVEHKIEVLKFTEEAKKLAEEYIKRGAIPKSEPEDAYHVAIATVNKIEALAAWNFKHVVSLNPIRKIHEINKRKKHQLIEISSLEMFGGSKYGNL
ncbi:MAG: type II toxin-antitoxin system VapC family toxin [bacterium]